MDSWPAAAGILEALPLSFHVADPIKHLIRWFSIKFPSRRFVWPYTRSPVRLRADLVRHLYDAFLCIPLKRAVKLGINYGPFPPLKMRYLIYIRHQALGSDQSPFQLQTHHLLILPAFSLSLLPCLLHHRLQHPAPYKSTAALGLSNTRFRMDPMTALTVATSVIAFVEFGGKLIGRYFEVRETTK